MTECIIKEISNSQSNISVNTESLESGFYILQVIYSEETRSTLPFIKN